MTPPARPRTRARIRSRFVQIPEQSFAILLIPTLLALTILVFARWLYPNPHELEAQQDRIETQGMNTLFWLYLLGASLIAAGYADFPLMAYHFQKTNILSPIWIPISYAIAMGLNSISAPLFGYIYDRKGFSILIIVSIFSCLFAPLVFLGDSTYALVGVGLSQKKQLSSTTQSICIESTSFSRIFLLTVVVTTAFAKKSSKSLYLQRILTARYDDNCFF